MPGKNLSECYKVGSFPTIGHGNPSALFSYRNLHYRNHNPSEYPFYLAIPEFSSKIGRKLHWLMTVSERLREAYSDSEGLRSSILGNIYGALLFRETAAAIAAIPEHIWRKHAEWVVVQEHLLLGASPQDLLQLHLKNITNNHPFDYTRTTIRIPQVLQINEFMVPSRRK